MSKSVPPRATTASPVAAVDPAPAWRQNQVFGIFRQRQPVEHCLQPAAVVVSVADQHCSQKPGTILGDDQLLVDLAALVNE